MEEIKENWAEELAKVVVNKVKKPKEDEILVIKLPDSWPEKDAQRLRDGFEERGVIDVFLLLGDVEIYYAKK